MYTRYQYHWCWLISATHREKKEKTRKSILHLFEWHFIPHTLSPEGKILAVHASRSTVSSMHLHLLQAPTRSLILLPIGWWSEACAVSKDERPHRSIHPNQTDKIDRSIAHKASDVASSSLHILHCMHIEDYYSRLAVYFFALYNLTYRYNNRFMQKVSVVLRCIYVPLTFVCGVNFFYFIFMLVVSRFEKLLHDDPLYAY